VETAAEALAKTYEHNTVEFNEELHIGPLIATLEGDNQSYAVRKSAIDALKQIIRHGLLNDSPEAKTKLIQVTNNCC
jgi:hypothetical protein